MSSEARTHETPIENKIGRILKSRKMTVTTAESCTGGLVSGTLVNAEGISDVFKEGFVTYSNQAKEKMLHVKHETLKSYGAVSKETAEEMARGAAKEAQADAAIAVTGIAGPGGGTPEKPVGLVYIGCYIKGKVIVKKCFFSGNREKIRNSSVKEALDLLYCQLLVDDEQKVVIAENLVEEDVVAENTAEAATIEEEMAEANVVDEDEVEEDVAEAETIEKDEVEENVTEE